MNRNALDLASSNPRKCKSVIDLLIEEGMDVSCEDEVTRLIVK